MTKYPLYQPPVGPVAGITNLIDQVWRYGVFTKGPHVMALEEELGEYLDVEHIVLTSSGTMALMIGMMAAIKTGYIKLNSVLLMSPYTWRSVPYAVDGARLVPYYGDIDLDYWHLDYEKASLTPGFDYVMLCDTFGARTATEPEEPYFVDAAHSFGLPWVGSRGLFEAFSMAATKVLPAGEGGFISTTHRDLAEKARDIARLMGRLPEASAVLARAYLDKMDDMLMYRGLINTYYTSLLKDHCQLQKGDPHNNYLSCVRLDEDQMNRVIAQDIFEYRRYYNPTLDEGCWNAVAMAESVVALPQVSKECCIEVANIIKGEVE